MFFILFYFFYSYTGRSIYFAFYILAKSLYKINGEFQTRLLNVGGLESLASLKSEVISLEAANNFQNN